MDLDKLIDSLPVHERERFLEQVGEYRYARDREVGQASFMAFVR